MREVAKPAVADADAQRQPSELYCPQCGLRLTIGWRANAPCSVSYSVEKWADRCLHSDLDSPLACLMFASRVGARAS